MLSSLLLPICCLLAAAQPLLAKKFDPTQQAEIESWSGRWFPHPPNLDELASDDPADLCDDGQHAISIDYDPYDKRHAYQHLCLGNRSLFEPQLTRSPILTEHYVPRAYVPPVKCLNESISYDEPIPTYGAFRVLPPQYGKYVYLPPQRWLRSLAAGAIVLLYHPCAQSAQVTAVQNTLQACLYRHIITPALALSPERPIALLAWGRSLEMSVVDTKIIVRFVKEHAKEGPLARDSRTPPTKTYSAGLVAEARLITDLNDSEVCGYQEM